MEKFIPNNTECLFLRTWYAVRGCEAPFTENMFDTICNALSRHYGSGFNSSDIRQEVVSAFISMTARQTKLSSFSGQTHKPEKKQKAIATIEGFLNKLSKLRKGIKDETD